MKEEKLAEQVAVTDETHIQELFLGKGQLREDSDERRKAGGIGCDH